ncbi:hypothetical protein O181_019162 [Austropuccinia psidii MF-1]|uniref:Uncharacterized protein n=1 Tax=Austropuccinia psidii MF-1 TaxID=1389203 RepID=A0A9Q3CB01_9BASI|nr:hypothetical protein [Austropuccinia psidii MF-1]
MSAKGLWPQSVVFGQRHKNCNLLRRYHPKGLLDHSTPFNKWFERIPIYHHLQPFGCPFYYINDLIRRKFSDQGLGGIFLGYKKGHQEYQILDRCTDLDQTLTSSNPRVTKQGKRNSPERINLEISAQTPSRQDTEPDSIENST